MLRTIFICCLVLTLTKRTVNSSSLDGGLAYLTKHLNKQNLAVPMIPLRDTPVHNTKQSVNVDQEEALVSKVAKAPVFQNTPLLSRVTATTTVPSYFSSTTASIMQQEHGMDLVANSNFVAVAGQKIESLPSSNPSQNVNRLPPTILKLNSVSKPEKLSVVEAINAPQDSTATPPPFIISVTSAPRQEISIVPPKYASAFRGSGQQFPKAIVLSPSTEHSAVARFPLETIKQVEQQKSTSTSTTTEIPTTTIPSSTVTSPTSCRHGEIYPMNTGSCDQFLMCHNSVVVLMICPQGMGFDIQKNRCEWSQVVPGCQGSENEQS